MRYCTCHHLVGGWSNIASPDISEGIESDKLVGGWSNIASPDISEGIESGAGLTINHKLGRPSIKGGAVKASVIKDVLKSGYKMPNEQEKEIDGYIRDDSLSGRRSQVYHNPTTKDTIISHRGTEGTASDWLNNLAYATGLYKTTNRFKHASDAQKKVEEKYGQKNVNTLGHSQGSAIADLVGKNSKNIITLDRPSNISTLLKKSGKNHYDIRTDTDLVSAMNPIQRKSNKAITINAGTYNPLKSHDVNQMSKLGEQLIGNGAVKRKTKSKRNN